MLATFAPWTLLALLPFTAGCQSLTAPRLEGDPEIVGAVEITDPATLERIESEYRDVSECLGVPFDPGKLRLTRFHTAESLRYDDKSVAGLWIADEYVYVTRPIYWPSMRHELVHRITGDAGHNGPGWECEAFDWREAET